MFKKPLFIDAIVVFIILGVLHYFANTYHLYWTIKEFDSIVHFIGGAALSLFFCWFYFFSDFFEPKNRTLVFFACVSVLGALYFGLIWEMYELVFGNTMVQKVDYPFDLFMDLIMDFLGAAAGCLYCYIKEYNRKIILKNGL